MARMGHFKLLIFLSLIIVISANDSLRRYCGPNLKKAVEAVCNSLYVDTYADDPGDDYRNDRYGDYKPAALIFTQKPPTQAPLNRHYYKRDLARSSLVDDCCIKPCSTATLRLYCF